MSAASQQNAVDFPRTKTDVGLEAAPALELTILMPCLNEADTVATCVRKAVSFLERHGVSGEVLVADNGSTDGSRKLAAAAGARVVAIDERGYGAALAGGIEAAHGRFVIMGDADDSYAFESLEPMLAQLRSGVDLVMGNRFAGGIAPGAMPFLHRYLGNPVLSFLGRLFFHVPIGDFHCGLRGFSKQAVLGLNLRSTGMEFASEMVVKAKLRGLAIHETPTTLSPDGRSRAPHLKTWRDGWRHLRFLLLHSPRWLFLYPGLALILPGLLLGGALARGPIQLTPSVVLDFHTLVVACFAVLVGLQLILFSALARRYAIVEGFLPRPAHFEGFIAGLTLERILQAAVALILVGVGGVVWSVAYWAGRDFGQISSPLVLRMLMLSLTAISAAIQLAASGFLASVFTIRR